VQDWLFYTVDLEITNRCGQACAFCPRQAIYRDRGEMPVDVFETVAASLLQTSAQVTLSGMGDPLEHPQWESFLRHYRARGGTMGMQVSAASLDRGRVEQLVRAAPSFINLSLPAVSADTLGRLLPGCDPQQVMEQALLLVERCRRHVPLSIIGVRTALQPEDEPNGFLDFWRARKTPVRIFDCHSRGGNLEDERLLGKGRTPGLEQPCGLFARHAFITWQGELLACCHDLGAETRLGDLCRDGIGELAARKSALVDRVPPFELCRSCDEPLRLLPLPDGPAPRTRREISRYLRFLNKFSRSALG
jgi:hypothetical protein